MIVLLLIASLVVRYLPLYHSTSPHPEWNTPCGANLLLPYIRFSSVLPFLLSLPCVRVFHLSLYTASFLTAIGMRYYHAPIAHRLKAWLSHYRGKEGRMPFIVQQYKLFLLYVEVNATVYEFLDRDKHLKRIATQS